MKRALFLFFIFCFSLVHAQKQVHELPDSLGFTDSNEAKNLTVNDLKEGKWIEHFDDSQYPEGEVYYTLTIYKADKETGIERAYYADKGKLLFTSPYKEGKLNGVYKEYYESGQLRMESYYSNGKENGITKYLRENGTLSTETTYLKGKMEGKQNWYYETGKLKKEVHYKNGEQVGLIKEYYENGALKSVYIDTAERVHKMIVGTWVNIESPTLNWVIKYDTVITESQCWTDYSISIESPPDKKVPGTYWFGIDYLICGDSDITSRQFMGGISTDSTYLKLHDFSNEETFVFKRKSK